MTLNLPLLYFVWNEEYCQTSPNKNKSPNLWHVLSILVCCIFVFRFWVLVNVSGLNQESDLVIDYLPAHPSRLLDLPKALWCQTNSLWFVGDILSTNLMNCSTNTDWAELLLLLVRWACQSETRLEVQFRKKFKFV